MKYFTAGVVSLIIALISITPIRAGEEEEDSDIPINERATAEAWSALRAGNNQEAIEKANECLDRFQKSADTIQSILQQQNATLPNGNVSEEDHERIYRYQILHDVATCLLIRAWAEEILGQSKKAVADHQQVRRYTYARTREHSEGPYWSPAEVALQNLERLAR